MHGRKEYQLRDFIFCLYLRRKAFVLEALCDPDDPVEKAYSLMVLSLGSGFSSLLMSSYSILDLHYTFC